MEALTRTSNLLRFDLPLHQLEKNKKNPNKMSGREFDLLVDNIQRTGLTDPVLVRPMDLPSLKETIKGAKTMDAARQKVEADQSIFRIVGGHHRFDAAAYLGFEHVPVTVIMSEDFDEEAEQFQLVRMNAIHGQLEPNAFFELYSGLSAKYSDEILQEMFGFSEEKEFQRLIQQTAKGIEDPAMKKKFTEAAAEIKTIDGLSKLLNELFTKYGDTLPYGYMLFDHGGQRSMWLRIGPKTMNALDLVGTMCIDKQRTVDDIIGGLVQLIAKGELAETVDKLIASTKAVQIAPGFGVAPTADNLEKAAAL